MSHDLRVLLFTSLLFGCGESLPHSIEDDIAAPLPSEAASDATNDAANDAVLHSRCVAPPGVSNAPRSIAEAVTLVNALPKPVTVACYLEALARPLELYATRGAISAQPAVGARSPRIFLFFDPLIASVVPDGMGRDLVEFGELESDTRSLKGELRFPIGAEVSADEPFAHLLFQGSRTACSLCHAEEVPHAELTFATAFVSRSLKPRPEERVSLTDLITEFLNCDPSAEPERCAILNGLFEQGDVVDRDFPEAMPTFY